MRLTPAPSEAKIASLVAAHPALRKTGGKRIFELRPDVEWDKGSALWSLFERAGLHTATAIPVYIGDDETDEDGFPVYDFVDDSFRGIFLGNQGVCDALD